VLANTLVVLTADHGEELGDHGSWKHGQTLYQEMIRVPLLMRWDGTSRPAAGIAGTVRLLDLLPTLNAAAGGKPDALWQGIDLLPALLGRSPVPRQAAFAETLSSGPARASVVVDGKKLVLFNRRSPVRAGRRAAGETVEDRPRPPRARRALRSARRCR
jgi:arylsulfatase A-like enzyme